MSTTPDRLAVGVIGCGRMGRLHARVCSQMPQVRLAGVYDLDDEAARQTAQQYGTRAADSLEQLLAQVRAAVIAVPTQMHLAVAQQCLQRGIACLIEKPLAATAIDAARLVELATAAKVVVQAGHIERFNPAVRALQKLNLRPRFIEVVRISPLTFRSLDVGVVLDMMIHDLDIVLHLAGSTVTSIDAAGASVVSPTEDVCSARLKFANGCSANLTASRLAMKTERRLRLFAQEAFASIDYQHRQGAVIRRSGNLDTLREVVQRVRLGQVTDFSQLSYKDLVKIEPLAIDEREPAREQLESFVEAVIRGGRPAVSAVEGLAAVELAQRIVDAMGEDVRV